jgi:hypothetical protein
VDSEEMDFKALVIAARARKTEGLTAPNAIPTEYKGVKFRSRLEAKWAIFFDTLGIEWEYEPQGYEIGTGYDAHWPRYLFSDGETLPFQTRESAELHIKLAKEIVDKDITILDVSEPLGSLDPNLEWYLPDFWLPGLEVWAEVKGQFGWEELRTAVRATDGFSKTLPNVGLKDLRDPRNTVAGLLYLGNIPNPERPATGSHVIFRNHKGTEPHTVKFVFNPVNNRVELKEEKGGPIRYWFSFDVYNCHNEQSTISNYGEIIPRLKKDIVNGVPRQEKTEQEKNREKWKFLGMPDVTRAVVMQKTEEEMFAEDVIKAGWAAARNYQFK